MKEFEMNTQYAEFYQNVVKRDFTSSKLFIFLCAFTFATSLISISLLSNMEKGPQSQKLLSNLSVPQLIPIVKKETFTAAPAPVNLASAPIQQPVVEEKASKPQAAPQATPEKKLDLLMLTPHQHIKMLAHNLQPPHFLPTLPNMDRFIEPKKTVPEPSSRLVVIDFKIKKNLVKDTKNAGLSRYLTTELAHAFSEKLDLKKARPGDRITFLYHTDAKKTKGGQILAAKYISRNEVIKVVRLREGRHRNAFYALDKLNESRLPQSTVSILRKPIKSGRVSSPFHHHRFHPILKRYRAHLGVDYAAPAGSPIMASGSGKITYVGYQHGYGNLVIIQHDGKYSTRYGHMARFAKIKAGTTVKQGDVIGYVGRTGYATGHHVHYEIRINGKPYNPLTVALPNSRRMPVISKQKQKEIASKAKLLFAKMEELSRKRNG